MGPGKPVCKSGFVITPLLSGWNHPGETHKAIFFRAPMSLHSNKDRLRRPILYAKSKRCWALFSGISPFGRWSRKQISLLRICCWFYTLRMIGSQNRWFGDARTLLYRFNPVYRRFQWLLGNGVCLVVDFLRFGEYFWNSFQTPSILIGGNLNPGRGGIGIPKHLLRRLLGVPNTFWMPTVVDFKPLSKQRTQKHKR